jgi:D-alanyl-D-alanine carboxypeptidase/D-alanyl-D-alanine-endopeptidase (penicillin-binding protein 4)
MFFSRDFLWSLPMNWMRMDIKRHASMLLAVTLASAAHADFDKPTLNRQFSCIKGADHGVIFTRLSDGQILFEANADTLLSPASVTKVMTSAVALAYFGPAYSFKTPVYYSGKFAAGKITGNLYIVGNGDPFVVSEVLWQTAVDLKHLGVREITGNLIIDQSLFDDETRDESRKNSTQKSTHAYDAPVSAFAVNFNTVAVATAPSLPGKPAISGVTPFPLAHVKLAGRSLTGKGDQNSAVTLSRHTTPDGGITLTTGGVIGIDAPIKKLYRSAGDPNIAAGDYVLGFLREAGIKVRGKVSTGQKPAAAKFLYDISGYEMRRIAQGLNTFSNNFIADMLTKRLGAAFASEDSSDGPGSGTLASGVKVLSQFLRADVGIKGDFTVLNGSGLATENRVTARQITTVLNWMEKRGELFPDFLASLPANGWDGTLKKRIKKSDGMAGQIHAKSGTLTEPITVAALAGYFRHPKEGWVSFAIISNGREGRGQPGLMEIRNLQDDVLKQILMN